MNPIFHPNCCLICAGLVIIRHCVRVSLIWILISLATYNRPFFLLQISTSRVTGPFYCYPHLNLSRLRLLSALSDQVQCCFLRPPGLPPSIWCYSLLNLLLPLTSSRAVLHLIHFCPPLHLNKSGGIPLLPSTVSNQAGGRSTPLSTSSDQVRRCSTIVPCPIRLSPTATLYLI